MLARFVLRSLVAFLLTGALAATPAAAQSSDLTSFSFLRLEPSARAAALGGSFNTIRDGDVNGLFYNPASLSEQAHNALSVSYMNHLSDLNAGFAAFGRHVEGVGSFGAGLRFLSYGTIDGRSANDVDQPDFGASDAALTLGYAREAANERLRYGGSAHLIYSHIAEAEAVAAAADLGAMYSFPSQQLTFSASLHNVGTTFSSLGPSRDELPVDLRVGLSKKLAHLPLLLSVTGYNLQNVGAAHQGTGAFDNAMRHVRVGGEFQFSEAFQARIGYNHMRHEELKTQDRLDPAGFSFGFGLAVSRIALDYAYNSWSSFGRLHQLTVRTSF
jgi:hypothetical protein